MAFFSISSFAISVLLFKAAWCNNVRLLVSFLSISGLFSRYLFIILKSFEDTAANTFSKVIMSLSLNAMLLFSSLLTNLKAAVFSSRKFLSVIILEERVSLNISTNAANSTEKLPP